MDVLTHLVFLVYICIIDAARNCFRQEQCQQGMLMGRVTVMVFNRSFNIYFSYIVVVSFYWWRKLEFPEKTTDLLLLDNIQYLNKRHYYLHACEILRFSTEKQMGILIREFILSEHPSKRIGLVQNGHPPPHQDVTCSSHDIAAKLHNWGSITITHKLLQGSRIRT